MKELNFEPRMKEFAAAAANEAEKAAKLIAEGKYHLAEQLTQSATYLLNFVQRAQKVASAADEGKDFGVMPTQPDYRAVAMLNLFVDNEQSARAILRSCKQSVVDKVLAGLDESPVISEKVKDTAEANTRSLDDDGNFTQEKVKAAIKTGLQLAQLVTMPDDSTMQ